jgi:hypothetical protein
MPWKASSVMEERLRFGEVVSGAKLVRFVRNLSLHLGRMQRSKQSNLFFDCRISVDGIAGYCRRDHFDGCGLPTARRL